MVVQLNNLPSLVYLGNYLGIASHMTKLYLEIPNNFNLGNGFLCILFLPTYSKVKTCVIFINFIATKSLLMSSN